MGKFLRIVEVTGEIKYLLTFHKLRAIHSDRVSIGIPLVCELWQPTKWVALAEEGGLRELEPPNNLDD